MTEKVWLKTKSDSEKEHYLHLDGVYKTHLYHNKSHITNLLDNSKNRSGTLYKILRSFAKPEENNPLPDINKEKLMDEFADYFLNKIEKKSGSFYKEKRNIHHQLGPAPSYQTSNLLQKSKYSLSSSTCIIQHVQWIHVIPSF